jgi:F-type H+-transporting ATPase subunit delta
MSLSLFEQQRTAKRYALALYALAVDAKKVPNVAAELELLADTFHVSPEFHELCVSPLICPKKRNVAIDAICKQAKAEGLVRSFLIKLSENNRLMLLVHIKDAFIALKQKDAGEVVVTITSAGALSLHEKKQLEASIADALGKRIVPHYSEDASLIAGVTIRYGSRELDASVRGTLHRAAARFTKSIQQTSS